MLHVLGEHTDIIAELYQTNVKSQGLFIEPRSAQVALINACSKSLITKKPCIIVVYISYAQGRTTNLARFHKVITTVQCSICS